jgi:hypothetical protein
VKQADSPNTTTTSADPMIELVYQHRWARRAIIGLPYAIGAFEQTVPDGPEWSYSRSQPRPPEGCSDPATLMALNVALGEAYERDHDLLARLLSTDPTSFAGMADLMEHLALPEYPDDTTGSAPQKETILTAALNYPQEGVVAAARAFPKRIAAAAHVLAATGPCARSTEVVR